jgi:hypothetical protein
VREMVVVVSCKHKEEVEMDMVVVVSCKHMEE